MILEHPERLVVVAVGMMLFGCVMPFLMVIHVVESTFFLNFLSYTLSVLGLFLGITGVALLRVRQKKNDDDDQYR
ncbi:MAG TPA: hypothetical protein PKL78_03425 [Anaerolineales bacterium]|nr:hypothetical protein [Anaerolineales bacterium]HNN12582.1 hypothetical protein [Anaerolineales bacterium]HNO31374.1 hypothetical protein [Anaerolineales bacterium]